MTDFAQIKLLYKQFLNLSKEIENAIKEENYELASKKASQRESLIEQMYAAYKTANITDEERKIIDDINSKIQEKYKKTLDSLIKVNPTTKDSINQCIAKLKGQYSSISKTSKSNTAKTPFWSSLSIKTIILIVITFILVAAFIASLILFSGILKLFKKKNKMEEINTPNTNIDSVELENLQSNDTIEFVYEKASCDKMCARGYFYLKFWLLEKLS